MRRLWTWLGSVALIAACVHLASLWYVPRYIMTRVMDGAAAIEGSNVFINRPVADAEARTIVRPSPDLMYSLCVLDVAAAPVRIRAPASAPYTSLSVFAANSDNVFVQNDRALDGPGFEVWIAQEGQAVPEAATVARLPGPRGIALVRRVITGPEQARELDTLRREADCSATAS